MPGYASLVQALSFSLRRLSTNTNTSAASGAPLLLALALSPASSPQLALPWYLLAPYVDLFNFQAFDMGGDEVLGATPYIETPLYDCTEAYGLSVNSLVDQVRVGCMAGRMWILWVLSPYAARRLACADTCPRRPMTEPSLCATLTRRVAAAGGGCAAPAPQPDCLRSGPDLRAGRRRRGWRWVAGCVLLGWRNGRQALGAAKTQTARSALRLLCTLPLALTCHPRACACRSRLTRPLPGRRGPSRPGRAAVATAGRRQCGQWQ